MASVLGIDIGTSSVKVMLLDVERGVIGVESRGYDVLIPQIGYAQQDPDTWWEAVISCLSRLRTRYSREYREDKRGMRGAGPDTFNAAESRCAAQPDFYRIRPSLPALGKET